MKSLGEKVLPLRSARQPAPAINKGGDCGFCCVAGILQISVGEAYQFFPKKEEDGSGNRGLSWYGMRELLWSLVTEHQKLDRIIDRVPFWMASSGLRQFDMHCDNLAWFAYARMAIDAGYYGLASIRHDGTGPLVDSDHWVLFCGARERREPHPTVQNASVIKQEILASCSATCPAGKWVEPREYLRRHGGFNALWVRPA